MDPGCGLFFNIVEKSANASQRWRKAGEEDELKQGVLAEREGSVQVTSLF